MSSLSERYLVAKRRLFDKVLSQRLNDRQREAVCATEGPVLVLAGAGSGKTTVLVHRIVHIIRYGDGYATEAVPDGLTEAHVEALERAYDLPSDQIEQGVLPEFISHPCPPWAMLAITFTNKAAREIRERLAAAFDDQSVSEQIWAGTFHSVCLRILRKYSAEAGYKPAFTIYDTDDKRMILQDICKELKLDEKTLPVKTVAAEISRAKDNLLLPDELDAQDARGRDIARAYAVYQQRLRRFNAMDFDDIIMQTVRLLQNCQEARAWCQHKFRYVSVDEYQDTNYAQFRLAELLSSGSRNIMVVGDDDQSIYRFRGATVENILSFDRTYRDCKVIKLEQNYRSTKTILEAANAIIRKNDKRHAKTLWCDAEQGDPLSVHTCDNQYDEARFITDTVMTTVIRQKKRYRDFAVLYRINEMARVLESSFAKSGIPYRVLGAQRFYDRKEIRDMTAYLAVVRNPDDTGRLGRIINVPRRGIGAKAMEAVELLAEQTGQSAFRVMEQADAFPALARYAATMTSFAALIRSFDPETDSPSRLLGDIFQRTGYEEMLREEGEASKVRIDGVREFISAAEEYEKRAEKLEDTPTLTGFLEEIELVSDVDKYDEDADAVVLMTVHSAKGLEFPIVFLPGMEEGIFPSSKSFSEPEELNEERRLAYVAVTRAKEKIFVTHARERLLYGRTTPGKLSRFIDQDVPEHLRQEQEQARAFAPPRTVYGRQGYQKKPAVSQRAYTPPTGGKPVSPFGSAMRPASKYRFGVEKFAIGTKVRHSTFGVGIVEQAKDMGGDVMYQIAFDDGSVKKLMATYAKLEKI